MHGIFLSALVPRNDRGFTRPLGPYRIADHLRKNGYQIQVIDFVHMLTQDEILELIAHFITAETKFIGLGFMIDGKHPKVRSHYGFLGKLLLSVKKNFPNVKIIIGGSTGFNWSPNWPNKSLFDYIVKGYGEDQTLALFDHHYKGAAHPPFEVLDGNIHLSEHLVTECRYTFNDSIHSWDRRDCIQPGEPLPIEFARGCIFKCSFCRYPHIGKSKDEYAKKLEHVKAELLDNYEKFGTTTYYITDDTFNADDDFVRNFTDMAKSLPFKLQYSTYIRADLLQAHPEQEDMFLENGLVSAFFGVESFDEKTAALYTKPWSAKKGKEYISYLNNDKWKNKIHNTLGLICGGPHETLEDYKATDKWCIDNNIPSWLWHPLHVSPDIMYYKSQLDKEYLKRGFRFKLLEGQTIWYHDKCDQAQAVEWAQELWNETRPYQTLPSWSLIEHSAYGYKYDKVLFWKVDQYNWNYVSSEIDRLLAAYKKDLWNL